MNVLKQRFLCVVWSLGRGFSGFKDGGQVSLPVWDFAQQVAAWSPGGGAVTVAVKVHTEPVKNTEIL